jgi:hypothetical protein
MVSGLAVLKHICLFCGHINMLPLGKLYYDNLGLIKKVSYFFKYRLAKVKCVLHSEYGVVNQIFRLLQEHTATPEINHVKGHQDNKIPYVSLPLPAQLNVDADSLATKELHDRPNLIHHVPLFLTAKYNYSSAERPLQEIFQAPSANTKDIAIWFHTCSSVMDGLTTSQPLLTGMDSLPPTNRAFSKESLYLNFVRNSCHQAKLFIGARAASTTAALLVVRPRSPTITCSSVRTSAANAGKAPQPPP